MSDIRLIESGRVGRVTYGRIAPDGDLVDAALSAIEP